MRVWVDLDAAVAAGILGEDQAGALRNFEAERAGAPNATEESLHLVGGLSDLMTAGGMLLVLLVLTVGAAAFPPLAAGLAFCCWKAARHFTQRRRMMTSSFVLFGFFLLYLNIAIGGVTGLYGVEPLSFGRPDTPPPWQLALVGSAFAVACTYYWKVFRLPIAVATAAFALVLAANGLLAALFPGLPVMVRDTLSAIWALALFGYAMLWDMSDIRRETPRSDVAFWLHCAAGFYLTKSVFVALFGITPFSAGSFAADVQAGASLPLAVLGMYALFCAVSLIIDRRSLVVSSLVYTVPALGFLFGGSSGPIGLAVAILLTGLFLVTLSLKWTSWRRHLLDRLPHTITAQVPRPDVTLDGRRPSRRHLEMSPRRSPAIRRDAA